MDLLSLSPARPASEDSAPVPAEHATAAVAVVGLGYVGLPTALALLAAGNEVVGIDVSEARLAAIRSGDVDLLPSDHDRLTAHRDDPRFTLTADPAAIQRARTVVVCCRPPSTVTSSPT